MVVITFLFIGMVWMAACAVFSILSLIVPAWRPKTTQQRWEESQQRQQIAARMAYRRSQRPPGIWFW